MRDAKGNVTGTTSIGENMTERKMAEEMLLAYKDRLEHIAHHDQLTGLPNRTLFNDRIAVAIARARRNGGRVGLQFVDLDRFKQINDSLGHSAGDQVLKDAAARISGCIRDCDTAARMGGDEFAVLLPDIAGAQEAESIAKRILESLSEPVTLEGEKTWLSLSIGIAVFPDDGPDARTLLKNADRALYRAKELGRGNYQLFGEYGPDVNAPVRRARRKTA